MQVSGAANFKRGLGETYSKLTLYFLLTDLDICSLDGAELLSQNTCFFSWSVHGEDGLEVNPLGNKAKYILLKLK